MTRNDQQRYAMSVSGLIPSSGSSMVSHGVNSVRQSFGRYLNLMRLSGLSNYTIKEVPKGWQIVGPNDEVVGKYTYSHKWKAVYYLNKIKQIKKIKKMER